jgi:O-antigen ligase
MQSGVLNYRNEHFLMAQARKVSGREYISVWLRKAARVCFGAAILVMPLRLRIVLLPRPQAAIPSGYTDFTLFAADVAVILTLALWTSSLVILPRPLQLGTRGIWIPLAGLTLAGWASTVYSYDHLLSVYHAIRLLGLFWFFIYIVNEISSLEWVLIPVGIQVVVQSVVALGQFVTQDSLSLQSIGELYLDPAQRGVSIVVVDGFRLLRSYGLTDHPNILGGCLAFGLLLFLHAYLHRISGWLTFVVLLPGAAALSVSFSRAAWLAFLLGAVVLVGLQLHRRRQEITKPLMVMGGAWLIVLLPVILSYPRFFGVRLNAGGSFKTPSVEQQSIGERLLLVHTAAAMVVDHPFLGVGLGAAPLALKIYQPDWPVSFEPPHSAILNAAVETGLPGAACYLALTIAPFLLLFARRSAFIANPAATAALAMLLSVMVVGIFDYYTWLLVPGRLLQWLAWGLFAKALMPGSSLTARVLEPNMKTAKLFSDVHPSP